MFIRAYLRASTKDQDANRAKDGVSTENGTIARSGILSGFFKSTVQKSLNQWVAYLKACLDK